MGPCCRCYETLNETFRRVRQIPKDVAWERLRNAKIDYDNDRILIRPKPPQPPPPPPTTPTPTPPPPRPPPISALPLAYEIPGSNEIRGNEIPGFLQFEESRNRGVGATGGKRRRRIPKRRKGRSASSYYLLFAKFSWQFAIDGIFLPLVILIKIPLLEGHLASLHYF